MNQGEIIAEAIDASVRAAMFGNIVLVLAVAIVAVMLVRSANARRAREEDDKLDREMLATMERISDRLDRLERAVGERIEALPETPAQVEDGQQDETRRIK